MSRAQNEGEIPNVKRTNKFFKNMVIYKYLEQTVTNQNCVH
jgi:hypothetical protein